MSYFVGIDLYSDLINYTKIFVRSVIIMTIFFFCSCAAASEMPAQDSFPVTTFTEKELTKGEPIGWKTHKGICREIKNRIMPRIVEMEGKKCFM
ncbi:MAG: hypothetical protein E3K36_11170 [Candidatus Brocadia sp.]|nr:hypothetical protein [Candidatus Brocadia sp.]